MKFKYTGGQDEITVRTVTFPKGKAVELDASDAAHRLLAAKVAALPYFEEVKPGRPRKIKDDQDGD